jgi:N utilization substance protein A
VLAEFGLSEEQGNEIIMAARAHWFEDEDQEQGEAVGSEEDAHAAESSQ